MAPGSNLFVKTFLAFWLVTCAVLASWMLASNYFESRPLSALQRIPHGPPLPHRRILRTIFVLQAVDRDELRDVRDSVEKLGIRLYLLDQRGKDLFGREVGADVEQIATHLGGPQRRIRHATTQELIVAHEIYRRDTGPLRTVFVIPRRGGALLNTLGGNPRLRILLAVSVSGLVCFALSRLLTNRLKALQKASRQLANGDLNTRLKVRERGGDETDELARDFNTMADQLQGRMQGQKRLLRDVSHELRSPLARLRIALALAEADTPGRTDHLARIEQEAERLEALIAQLLSSQAGDVRLDSPVDLVPLLRQLCEDGNFEGAAYGKSVRFTTQSAAALVSSAGDLLHRAFDNILRNALAHTASHTTVRVHLDEAEDRGEVTIEDGGPGVPEEELEVIFEDLYRVDTARSRDTGGYGLGLSIARRAIHQHGGEIRAHNTGTGLRVTVTLPRRT